jgi:hypothetical protein
MTLCREAVQLKIKMSPKNSPLKLNNSESQVFLTEATRLHSTLYRWFWVFRVTEININVPTNEYHDAS